MTDNDKKHFIIVEEYYIEKILALIKTYAECSITDCKACELGEVCKKAVELKNSVKELEGKWEADK